MTIRTESDLDKQILDTLEADRASLDRFASTPNRQLLGALVGPATASSGFWALASTKLMAILGTAAFIGVTTYYLLTPAAVITPVPVTTATQVAVAADDTVNSAQSSDHLFATPKATQRHSGELRTHEVRSVASPSRPVSAPTEQSTHSVKTIGKEAIDLDYWNTGQPELRQTPTKLEVQTRSK
jgi:hypothetical protein